MITGMGALTCCWLPFRELEDKLEAEQRKLLDLREAQAEQDAARIERINQPNYKATEFTSGREIQTKRRMRKAEEGGEAPEEEEEDCSASSTAASVSSRFLKRGTGGAGLVPLYDPKKKAASAPKASSTRSLFSQAQAAMAGSPASVSSRSALKSRAGARQPAAAKKAAAEEATDGRIGFFAPGGGFTCPNVFSLGGGSRGMMDPARPAYYGMPPGTPAWRMNIARAKRAFIVRAYVVSAFKMAARQGRKRDGLGTKERLDRMGSLSVFVPLVLDDFTDRFIEQQQQFSGVDSDMTRARSEGAPSVKSDGYKSDGGLSAKTDGDLEGALTDGGASSPRSVMDKTSGSEDNSEATDGGRSPTPLWPTRPGAGLSIVPPPSPTSSILPQIGSPLTPSRLGTSAPPPTSPLGVAMAGSPRPPTAPSSGLRPSPAPKSAHAKRRSSTSGSAADNFPTRPSTTVGGARRMRRGSEAGGTVSALAAEERRARIKARSEDALTRPRGGNLGSMTTRRLAVPGGDGGKVGSATGIANRLLGTSSTRSKLTKANLLADKFVMPEERPPQEFSPNLPVKSDEELAKARQLMTTYVNRANARWTDDFKWDLPQMFDVGQFEKLGECRHPCSASLPLWMASALIGPQQWQFPRFTCWGSGPSP